MDELQALIKKMLAAGESDKNILAATKKFKQNYVTSPEVNQPQTITSEFPIVPPSSKDVIVPDDDSDIIIPDDASDIIIPEGASDEAISIHEATRRGEVAGKIDAKKLWNTIFPDEPFSEIEINPIDIYKNSTRKIVNDVILDLSGLRDLRRIIENYPNEALKVGIMEKINPGGWFIDQLRHEGYLEFREKIREKTREKFKLVHGGQILDDFLNDDDLSKIIEGEINSNIEIASENELRKTSQKATDIIDNEGEQVYFDLTAATAKKIIDSIREPVENNLALKLHEARLNRIQYNQLVKGDNPAAHTEEINQLQKEWEDMQVGLNIAKESYNSKYKHDEMLIDLETGQRFIPLNEGDQCTNCVDRTPEYTKFMEHINEYRKSGDLSKIRADFSLFAVRYRDHLSMLDQTIKIGKLERSLYSKAHLFNLTRDIFPDVYDRYDPSNIEGRIITFNDLLTASRGLSRAMKQVYFDVNENKELILSDKPTDFHESLFILEDQDINMTVDKIGWKHVYLLDRDVGGEVENFYSFENLKSKLEIFTYGLITSLSGGIVDKYGNQVQIEQQIDDIILSSGAAKHLPRASLRNLVQDNTEFAIQTMSSLPMVITEFWVGGAGVGGVLKYAGKVPSILGLTKTKYFTPTWMNKALSTMYTTKAGGAVKATHRGHQIFKNGLKVNHPPGSDGAKAFLDWKKKGIMNNWNKHFNWGRWGIAHTIQAGSTEAIFRMVGMEPWHGVGFHIAGMGYNGWATRMGLRFNPKYFGKTAAEGWAPSLKFDKAAQSVFSRKSAPGKMIQSGVIMVPGVALGTIFEAMKKDMDGNEGWRTLLETHYGEWHDKSSPYYVPRKLFREVLTGLSFGFTHTTKAGWIYFSGRVNKVKSGLNGQLKVLREDPNFNPEKNKDDKMKEDKLVSFINELDAKMVEMNGSKKFVDDDVRIEYYKGRETEFDSKGNPMEYIYQKNNKGIPKGSTASIREAGQTDLKKSDKNYEHEMKTTTARINVYEGNLYTVGHETIHAWTQGIPQEGFEKFFQIIKGDIREYVGEYKFEQIINELYKNQDASTLSSEKIVNLVEILMKDTSKLIETNYFSRLQRRLNEFLNENLTKGRDPNGFDFQPDINTAGKAWRLLIQISKDLKNYRKGDLIPESIRELEEFVIDGTMLKDYGNKKVVGNKALKPKPPLSQIDMDKFSVEKLDKIFPIINGVINPDNLEPKELYEILNNQTKEEKQVWAYQAGLPILPWIVSKIKLKGKDVNLAYKENIAYELISPGGGLNNEWIKYDPRIIPVPSKFIVNTRITDFKIGTKVKKDQHYGRIITDIEDVRGTITGEPKLPGKEKPIYKIKVLKEFKTREPGFDKENNIETGLENIIKTAKRKNISIKEIGERSKDIIVSELYKYLDITPETTPAEFVAKAKPLVYARKRLLWEGLLEPFDLMKGVSQGIKNNFPSHWNPAQFGSDGKPLRFKYSQSGKTDVSGKVIPESKRRIGPPLSRKATEIPKDWNDYYFGEGVRGTEKKKRIIMLFEHWGRGVGPQSLALRFKNDIEFREDIKKSNPNLFLDITWRQVVQELTAAKPVTQAQMNMDVTLVRDHFVDPKFSRMSDRLLAIEDDPEISNATKGFVRDAVYFSIEKGDKEFINQETYEEITGIKEISNQLKLPKLKNKDGTEIEWNADIGNSTNPYVQRKIKDTHVFTVREFLKLLGGVHLPDLRSNVQSYIRTSMGPDVPYRVSDKGPIEKQHIKLRTPEQWLDNPKIFIESSGKKLSGKFQWINYVYRASQNPLKNDGAKYTLKINQDLKDRKINEQERNNLLNEWHLKKLIGPKNPALKDFSGKELWEIYEIVKESNQKFALLWMIARNKVVQTWKPNGYNSKKEATGFILATKAQQTNNRDGTDKAFAYTFRSVTNNPRQAKGASKEKPFNYIEHESPLIHRSYQHILNISKNGSNSVKYKEKSDEIIKSSNISITSVFNQKINDSKKEKGRTLKEGVRGNIGFGMFYGPGGKVKTSTNSILNIIRDFKDLNEQIRIGTKDGGRTELDILTDKIDPHKLLNMLDKMKELSLAQHLLRDDTGAEINVKSGNEKLAEQTNTYSQKNISNFELTKILQNKARAIAKARDINAPKKGASFLDFDDTVGETKSMIKYEIPRFLPSGKFNPAVVGWGKIPAKGKLTPEKFAQHHDRLSKYGAKFDYSEFTKVIKGKKGPLFEKLVKIQEKYGTENTFILTARPQEAAGPIQKFLKGLGVNIPKENIIGLEDGRPGAKANFIVKKAAEGYNEVYFVDDAIQNVKAVKDIIKVLGIDGKVREVKQQAQIDLDKGFNKILEESKGIKAFKTFSRGYAKMRGADIGKWKWWLPPSAAGFLDLMYPTFGRGKQGDKHMKWYDENLGKPYAHGFYELNNSKQRIHDDYQALKKQYPNIKKTINKDSGYKEFTNDAAARVYLWNKNGMEIPELSKTDIKALVKVVRSNPELQAYAEQVSKITQLKEGYVEPSESWLAKSIQHDLLDVSNVVGRKEFFKEWINNKNAIFTEANLNKLEGTFGSRYRSALEDMLYRMEKGMNKQRHTTSGERFFNKWVANAVGTIMFLNRRSALLQTVSALNFTNWSDNNPLKIGARFADQKQFWKDFVMIFNSPMLKQRRRGLTMDVNYEEIVNTIQNKKDKVSASVAYLLNKGFIFTKYSDNFAIAFGGATFYRNRLNTYLKHTKDKVEAKKKAFIDFQEASEPTQQSSRPDLISQQQASSLGKFFLNFQNVTTQNNRNGKRAVLDFVNRRGDWKTNLSKIVYYYGIQNIIFLGLQQALFAAYWDEDATDADINDKAISMGNGVLDIWLRGGGIVGVGLSTLKNTILQYMKESDKGWKGSEAKVLIQALNFSPPLSSKVRKIHNSMLERKFNKGSILKPSVLALEGATNIPFNEFYEMTEDAVAISTHQLETWQKVSIALGYPEWQIDYKPIPIVIPKRFKKKKKKKRKY